MIDFAALGSAMTSEMAFRKDSVRSLGKAWGVSPMTVNNIRKGKKLTAELFLRACIYTGTDPLAYWRDASVDYSALTDEGEQV